MFEERLAKLEATLTHLQDRLAVFDCIHSYNRGLDRLDADLLRSCYHPDAIDHHGPFFGSAEKFVQFAIDVESSFLITHHGISTQNCEIAGNCAFAESYVHFVVVMADGVTLGMGFGRYIDRLEKRDGRWAISLRRLVMDCGLISLPKSVRSLPSNKLNKTLRLNT